MQNKTVVVTGAGSGVGQAVAIALVAQGWNVALVGRRQDALESTVKATALAERCLVCPCDIADRSAVSAMGEKVRAQFGPVSALINAAGTNTPARSLDVLTYENYQTVMDANLNGAFYCVQEFLPGMRAQKSGTIINVISDAGKIASPKAGPSYVMSKFGLAGLTQSINAEERGNGVRACGIFPGDINTPLLEKRPTVPDASARERMMQPQDIADCILLCLNLPPRVIVEEMLVRPA